MRTRSTPRIRSPAWAQATRAWTPQGWPRHAQDCPTAAAPPLRHRRVPVWDASQPALLRLSQDGFKERQVKEIKNARLAMMAMLGFFVQSAVTDATPRALPLCLCLCRRACAAAEEDGRLISSLSSPVQLTTWWRT